MAAGLVRVNTRKVRQAVERLGAQVGQRSADALFAEVKAKTPVSRPNAGDPRPRRGGKLKAAWRLTRRAGGQRLAWRMENRTDYASFQDRGAGPHPIRPRNPRGFLVFYWPRVGRVVFLRHVNHPGNPAVGFLSDVVTPRRWVAQLVGKVRTTRVRA